MGAAAKPIGSSAAHSVGLPVHLADELRLVAVLDVEPRLRSSPTAGIAALDPAGIVLRVDHPDAGGGDDEVVDVARGIRDPSVVEHGRVVGELGVEVGGEATLDVGALGILGPCRG